MKNGVPQRAGWGKWKKDNQTEKKPFVNPLNPTGWRPPSVDVKRRRGSGSRGSDLFKMYD